jgi:hypothetical protein
MNGKPFDGVEDVASFIEVDGTWTWKNTATELYCAG